MYATFSWNYYQGYENLTFNRAQKKNRRENIKHAKYFACIIINANSIFEVEHYDRTEQFALEAIRRLVSISTVKADFLHWLQFATMVFHGKANTTCAVVLARHIWKTSRAMYD